MKKDIFCKSIFLISKPDGEIYCAADTEETASLIVSEDCSNGNLNCDGPLAPDEVVIDEVNLFSFKD